MNNPPITVLMPVFNSEKYLREAIDSILQQTFKDFKFLIIDDGSTDSSVEIITSYKDPRIQFFRNASNLGISATLNLGIELAKSELIARMDADDISYPKRLEKQYNFFKQNPDCVLLSTWAREVTIDKQPLITQYFKSKHYAYMLNFECWIYHPTVMYKKFAVEDVGKYSIPYCEDYDLWWKIAAKYKIANLEEVLLDYRCTEESLSRVSKRKEYEEYQHNLVARNINFYTEQTVKLAYEEIECLRYNGEDLLRENKVGPVVKMFKKLNKIAVTIVKKGNPNYTHDELVTAANFQKKRLFNLFRGRMAKHKLALILLLSGYYKLFLKRL